jgi:hypothetical protein
VDQVRPVPPQVARLPGDHLSGTHNTHRTLVERGGCWTAKKQITAPITIFGLQLIRYIYIYCVVHRYRIPFLNCNKFPFYKKVSKPLRLPKSIMVARLLPLILPFLGCLALSLLSDAFVVVAPQKPSLQRHPSSLSMAKKGFGAAPSSPTPKATPSKSKEGPSANASAEDEVEVVPLVAGADAFKQMQVMTGMRELAVLHVARCSLRSLSHCHKK